MRNSTLNNNKELQSDDSLHHTGSALSSESTSDAVVLIDDMDFEIIEVMLIEVLSTLTMDMLKSATHIINHFSAFISDTDYCEGHVIVTENEVNLYIEGNSPYICSLSRTNLH